MCADTCDADDVAMFDRFAAPPLAQTSACSVLWLRTGVLCRAQASYGHSQPGAYYGLACLPTHHLSFAVRAYFISFFMGALAGDLGCKPPKHSHRSLRLTETDAVRAGTGKNKSHRFALPPVVAHRLADAMLP